jgi:DNA relaxase NicK
METAINNIHGDSRSNGQAMGELLREKIDWLAYSQKSRTEWGFPAFIDNHWKPISPLRNYTNGQENKQGVKRFWNTMRDDQGKYVVLGGSSLDTLEEYRSELYSFTAGLDNKITRVDYCLDIMGGSFNPAAVVSHLRNRNVITHAKAIQRIQDDWKGGFSQYVGTKSSETYTRIYDKASEQGITGKWSRIETVYQGDRAEASLQAYLLHKSTRPLILAHVDFPKWKAWRRIMSGDKAKLIVSPKETKTRQWLMEQVCPAIAKELLLDDDQSFLFELIDRVKMEYKNLTKNDLGIDW